ncbi:hypothetical protein ALC60_13782 [Trachymyrmex zeteki]|uniref:DUF8207 domain-containing protein n=1 Tax=Mycetomoellerius zeteki TaxID=64791 RepID=A0A151WH70_9HYME|nr:hypothetical protein ALC60_13782 [Trachymyrmex zeteki]
MADVREREKIAREIEKTSESIRKKHRALRTDRIEEGIALDKHFKPLIEPLRLFVDNPGGRATKVQNRLQTSEGREVLRAHLGPLSQKYVEPILSGAQGKKVSGADHVYGVYLYNDGLMWGNKRFDVDDADNMIIDGVRYAGTPGLYELIFKRIPEGLLYTEEDMHKYKNMLLATNAHQHKHHSQGRLLSNRGYKYKHVIEPLMSITPKKQKKSGKGLLRAMTLNDNAIDYVHWDDPNELVDRLRLLDASHRSRNNAHDNEMLSIIEELREAGLIIN